MIRCVVSLEEKAINESLSSPKFRLFFYSTNYGMKAIPGSGTAFYWSLLSDLYIRVQCVPAECTVFVLKKGFCGFPSWNESQLPGKTLFNGLTLAMRIDKKVTTTLVWVKSGFYFDFERKLK